MKLLGHTPLRITGHRGRAVCVVLGCHTHSVALLACQIIPSALTKELGVFFISFPSLPVFHSCKLPVYSSEIHVQRPFWSWREGGGKWQLNPLMAISTSAVEGKGGGVQALWSTPKSQGRFYFLDLEHLMWFREKKRKDCTCQESSLKGNVTLKNYVWLWSILAPKQVCWASIRTLHSSSHVFGTTRAAC